MSSSDKEAKARAKEAKARAKEARASSFNAPGAATPQQKQKATSKENEEHNQEESLGEELGGDNGEERLNEDDDDFDDLEEELATAVANMKQVLVAGTAIAPVDNSALLATIQEQVSREEGSKSFHSYIPSDGVQITIKDKASGRNYNLPQLASCRNTSVVKWVRTLKEVCTAMQSATTGVLLKKGDSEQEVSTSSFKTNDPLQIVAGILNNDLKPLMSNAALVQMQVLAGKSSVLLLSNSDILNKISELAEEEPPETTIIEYLNAMQRIHDEYPQLALNGNVEEYMLGLLVEIETLQSKHAAFLNSGKLKIELHSRYVFALLRPLNLLTYMLKYITEASDYLDKSEEARGKVWSDTRGLLQKCVEAAKELDRLRQVNKQYLSNYKENTIFPHWNASDWSGFKKFDLSAAVPPAKRQESESKDGRATSHKATKI
jgi:hypothetical protein